MKKFFVLVLIISVFTVKNQAQVKIGDTDSPQRGVILELQSDTLGFLPPRVSLLGPLRPNPLPVHVQGNVVYNLNATDSLKVGLYYNTGARWVYLSTSLAKPWFYMPSIVIDVSGTGGTIDLYAEYIKQLNTNSGVGSLVINSTGAPIKALTTVPAAGDLYYYVTAYDDRVFNPPSITAAGVMTYTIKTGVAADDATYMNIVFVEK